MKKLVLILSFVFALGLFSVDAMSNKVVNKAPVKSEQTAKKVAEKPTTKPAVKKRTKGKKTTPKAQTTVKK